MLNGGKIYVGNNVSFSYGNQSPELDAVPLTWKEGDVRQYVGGTDLTIIRYQCTVAGTPGTWQTVSTGGAGSTPALIFQETFLYTGDYGNFGQTVYMAPATADWAYNGEGPTLNTYAIPPDTGLLPGPCKLTLTVWVDKNDWDVTVPDGITFAVFKNDGTPLGSGLVDADPTAVGRVDVISVDLASGVITDATGLYATFGADVGAGGARLNITVKLSLTRVFP